MRTDFLFRGRISPDDIVIRHVKSSLKKSVLISKESGHIWNRYLAEAAKKRLPLYDAAIYRLERLVKEGGRIELSLSKVSYKFAKTAPAIQQIDEFDERYYPMSLSTAGLIKTVDDKYVLGLKDSLKTNRSNIVMVGGVVSASEMKLKNGQDIFNAFTREVREELGVDGRDVADCTLRSIIKSNAMKIFLVFSASLRLNSEDLLKKFKHRDDKELESLKLVSATALKKTLSDLGGYRKHIHTLI
ncbi:MAG: hypothetical protein Q8O87_02885 [bacterium]|nr:hypothetical protein [bacterium]